VTTWKYGINYLITDQWRLRYTKSRDIRAPNLLELYNTATQNSNNSVYRGVTTATLAVSSGNPNLVPEKALTETFGVVYKPQWIDGLQASLDYYDIRITDAIGQLGAQRTIDLCDLGNAQACSNVLVNTSGGTTSLTVFTKQLNLSVQRAAGYDFETSLTRGVLGGQGRVRLLVNRAMQGYTQAPLSDPQYSLDTSANPKWRANLQLGFGRGQWNALVQGRYIGASVMNANVIVGNNDSNVNRVPSMWYTDVNLARKIALFGGNGEVFVGVTNLLDKDPPVDTRNPTSFSSPTQPAFDRSGRYFNFGVRMKY
jgi:iron complex outermembrane recepter protein